MKSSTRLLRAPIRGDDQQVAIEGTSKVSGGAAPPWIPLGSDRLDATSPCCQGELGSSPSPPGRRPTRPAGCGRTVTGSGARPRLGRSDRTPECRPDGRRRTLREPADAQRLPRRIRRIPSLRNDQPRTPLSESPSPGLWNSYGRRGQPAGRPMFHVKHRKATCPALQVALSRSACSTIASSREWCAPRQ